MTFDLDEMDRRFTDANVRLDLDEALTNRGSLLNNTVAFLGFALFGLFGPPSTGGEVGAILKRDPERASDMYIVAAAMSQLLDMSKGPRLAQGYKVIAEYIWDQFSGEDYWDLELEVLPWEK
jgi:hypothetical protein